MINNQVGERISAGTTEKQPREITVSLQDAAVQLETIRFGIMPISI